MVSGEGAVAEMRSYTKRIALCGILSALATVILFLGGLFPFATFTAPALAGILLWPVGLEFNLQSGLMAWIVVGLLSLFIVPDKEMSLIFLFLLGFYPQIKGKLDKIHSKPLEWLSKMAVFFITVFSMYGLILFLFPIGEIAQEFKETETLFLAALVAVAALTFVLYDLCLDRIRLVYYYRLRPILFGKGR